MIKKYNIELLRFVFSVIIVYFHILHSNILPYVQDIPSYLTLMQQCRNAQYIVECFFIISGYFLLNSIREEKYGFLHFFWKKVSRLWPVLAFSIVCSFLFIPLNGNLLNSILDLLFLQATGLSLAYKGINWYISPLFWTMLFYFAVLKKRENQKLLLVAIITYLAYLVNISVLNGGFGRETIMGIFNLGMCRALGGIGLGILLRILIENLNDLRIEIHPKVKTLLLNVIEIFSMVFLFAYFFGFVHYQNRFIVIPMFALLFLSFISQNGILSKKLNQPYFSILGRYSYSIYAMQQISFYILQRTLWKTDIVYNIWLCIGVSEIISVLIGVIIYHCIEKKGAGLLYSIIKFTK